MIYLKRMNTLKVDLSSISMFYSHHRENIAKGSNYLSSEFIAVSKVSDQYTKAGCQVLHIWLRVVMQYPSTQEIDLLT